MERNYVIVTLCIHFFVNSPEYLKSSHRQTEHGGNIYLEFAAELPLEQRQ